MTSTLLQQRYQLLNEKYFDLFAENQENKTLLLEKTELISQLRRDLNAAKLKAAKLQYLAQYDVFFTSKS